VTQQQSRRRSVDTTDLYGAAMASLGEFLLKLGNAGAIRNAAASVAERRAAEARLNATVRRFSETSSGTTSRRISAAG
jgi:hypothetical protein